MGGTYKGAEDSDDGFGFERHCGRFGVVVVEDGLKVVGGECDVQVGVVVSSENEWS
jgi:hypothetical protein